MSENNVQDVEVVEGSAELVPAEQPPPTTLFRTDDPEEVVERASSAAAALKRVLTEQRLTSSIQGREHVRVEGWQTLGTMLGVTSVCMWTRRLGDDKTGGWEARVEARTLDGRVIGAAEAECFRSERTWKSRDDYALRSMAQTRATSKALRSVLAFVVTLAGYDPTPAEEMPPEPQREQPKASPVRRPTATQPERSVKAATPAQRRLVMQKAKEAGIDEAALGRLLKATVGEGSVDRLPFADVNRVLAAIRGDEPDA